MPSPVYWLTGAYRIEPAAGDYEVEVRSGAARFRFRVTRANLGKFAASCAHVLESGKDFRGPEKSMCSP